MFLPLTWTVVHPIDEHSVLYGETVESLREAGAEVLALLKAFDETFSLPSFKLAPPTPSTTWFGARVLPMPSWLTQPSALPSAAAMERSRSICGFSTLSNQLPSD